MKRIFFPLPPPRAVRLARLHLLSNLFPRFTPRWSQAFPPVGEEKRRQVWTRSRCTTILRRRRNKQPPPTYLSIPKRKAAITSELGSATSHVVVPTLVLFKVKEEKKPRRHYGVFFHSLLVVLAPPPRLRLRDYHFLCMSRGVRLLLMRRGGVPRFPLRLLVWAPKWEKDLIFQ